MRKKLKNFIINQDLKQGELARILGITDKHMSELVNGKANPSMKLMHRFAKHFQMPFIEVVKLFEIKE